MPSIVALIPQPDVTRFVSRVMGGIFQNSVYSGGVGTPSNGQLSEELEREIRLVGKPVEHITANSYTIATREICQ